MADTYLASRALQRTLGSVVQTVAPSLVKFDRTCAHCGSSTHGKPRLVGVPSLDYSLSHSGGWVALAFTHDGRVGFDLESTARRFDARRLAARIASPSELRRLAAGRTATRERVTMRLWTRKEAVTKLTGHGFATPFSTFSVAAGRVVADPRPSGWPDDPLWVTDLDLDGCIAALASSPAPAQLFIEQAASLPEWQIG